MNTVAEYRNILITRKHEMDDMGFKPSLFCLALAGTLSLGAAFSAQPVTAQDSTFKSIMQEIGLAPSNKEEIEYRERAPLVVPPSGATGTLPPPQAERSVAGNPQWPTDPDVERRRKQREEDNVYAGKDYKSYLNRNNPWINPNELRANRREGAGLVTQADATNHDGRTVVSPDELRRGNPAMARQQDNTVEPTRRRLTDPPPGYRTTVPVTNPDGTVSAAAPEPEKKGFFKRINPFSKD